MTMGDATKYNGKSLPASVQHQWMWMLDSLDDSRCLYHVPLSFKFDGYLDIELLRRAFELTCERHDQLRVSFSMKADGLHFQSALYKPKFEVFETETDIEDNILVQIRKWTSIPFNLEEESLIKAGVFRAKTDGDYLVICAHHLVFDGWSGDIFLNELAEIYNGGQFSDDGSSPSFNEWLISNNGTNHETSLSYWCDALKDYPVKLDLPRDRFSKNSAPEILAGSLDFKLNQKSTEFIQSLASITKASEFMVAFALYCLFLFKYTGQNDFIVASPVSGRYEPDMFNLVGCFVNTLPYRVRIDPEKSLIDFIAEIRNLILSGLEHQDAPISTISREASKLNGARNDPLFQTMFTVDNFEMVNLILGQQNGHPISVSTFRPELTLEIGLIKKDGTYSGVIGFDIAKLSREMAFEISQLFKEFIDNLPKFSENALKSIPLLPVERQYEIIEKSGSSETNLKINHILSWFGLQVQIRPDKLALKSDSMQITYQQLYEAVIWMEHVLKAKGVKPGDVVGVSTKRSIASPVLVMAIFRCRAVYLPLDSSYPEDRLDFMIKDARPQYIITDSEEKFSADSGFTLLLLSDLHAWEVDEDLDVNSEDDFSPDETAYIMYTSGSTGQPKGICVNHRALSNLPHAAPQVHLDETTTMLLTASISFDVSIFELLVPFAVGATLVVPDEAVLNDPVELVKIIEKYKISNLHLPPSLLPYLSLNNFKSVPTIFCGGEHCDIELAHEWKVGRVFGTSYGPAECCVMTTAGDLQTEDIEVTLGRPIPNTRIYVMDEALNVLPSGVVGEICISGVNVGSKYLNNSALNARNYTSDPFTDWRLYRTGDLGRYTDDGRIVFVGRMDDQVKIRGFRIELNEIEEAVRRYLQVKDVVATVVDDHGKKFIRVFIIHHQSVERRDWENRLKAYLPSHMMPREIVRVSQFPLTPGGKTDRKALQSGIVPHKIADTQNPISLPDRKYVKEIHDIWAEVLGIPEIGVDSNFFEVGGDSLLITHVQIKIMEKLGIDDLPIVSLFEHPTIRSLAAYIDAPENLKQPAIADEEKPLKKRMFRRK